MGDTNATPFCAFGFQLLNRSPIPSTVTRPARGLLIAAVNAARTARGRKRKADLAGLIPNAADGVLCEEATQLRLALALALESARRAAVKLAGLDVALGAAPTPIVIVAPPLLGDAPRCLTAAPAEVEAAARVWRGFRAALALDPRAEVAIHLRFENSPPTPSLCGESRSGRGEAAAAGVGASAAVMGGAPT